MPDARGSWGELAEAEWKSEVVCPGAELLTDDPTLEEDAAGRMIWSSERIYRSPTGTWTWVRLRRATGEAGERVEVVAAATDEDLVAQLKATVGLTPGRIETLGRGGIEIGLEPDDELHD